MIKLALGMKIRNMNSLLHWNYHTKPNWYMIMITMQVLFLPFQVSETTITVGYCLVLF